MIQNRESKIQPQSYIRCSITLFGLSPLQGTQIHLIELHPQNPNYHFVLIEGWLIKKQLSWFISRHIIFALIKKEALRELPVPISIQKNFEVITLLVVLGKM
jgi:hypothetical protein